MKLSRALRPIVATACATGAILASVLLGSAQAIADPITDAQKQLAQLEAQTSVLEDKYNDSKARLDAAQTQQKQLAGDIETQQAQLEALTPSIVWIVTMQRQSSGINMTANFLLDDSEDSFLSQMSTAASVTNILDEQVARYVSEQQRLSDLKESLDTSVATIQAEVKTQKSLLAQAQQKQDAQQSVLNRLNAQQRAALDARNNSSASKSSTPSVNQGAASDRAMKVVNWALQQNGKRYVFGTAGPTTYDCSGLTMAAYAKVGIALPHSAHLQANYGKKVSRNALLPGDLLFFYFPISHVAIYIGNGKMIHASTPSTGVRISDISPSFNTARRLV